MPLEEPVNGTISSPFLKYVRCGSIGMDVYGGLASRMYSESPDHILPQARDKIDRAEIVIDLSRLMVTEGPRKGKIAANELTSKLKKEFEERGYHVKKNNFTEQGGHYSALTMIYPVSMPREDLFETMVEVAEEVSASCRSR